MGKWAEDLWDEEEEALDASSAFGDPTDDEWDTGEWDQEEIVLNGEVTQERTTDIWEEFLTRYYYDPVGFAENVLGFDLMPHQKRILGDVATGKRRIAIRSGHRVGKTALLSIVCCWFITTRYPQKTIVTAPTAGQLFNALVPEIKSLMRKLPDWLRELFDVLSEEIKLKADPDGSFLSARTASPENAESFQGIHSANVLFIWDEASGIDERLFNAARGSMAAPNAISIMAGNPVRLNNTFHRAFTTNAHLFSKHAISSIGLKTVDADFIEEVKSTYGEESNEYRVRVLGEFPDTDDESYISAALVRAARKRQIDVPKIAATVYAVDPAYYGGDRTVISRRVGAHVIKDQITLLKKNTMQVVGHIVQMAEEDRQLLMDNMREAGVTPRAMPKVPAAIVVDIIGIGAGIADRLEELKYDVIRVNVAEAATSEPKCHRERDAMYKRFLHWLQDGMCRIPDDDGLELELTAPQYEYDSNGVLKIENKKSVKKRIKVSPDKSDSAMLTLMVPIEKIIKFLENVGDQVFGYGSGPSGRLSGGRTVPTNSR